MKLTRAQLKQIVKEEVSRLFEAEKAYDTVRKGGGVRVHGTDQSPEPAGADLETAQGYDREVRAQRGGTFDVGGHERGGAPGMTTTVQRGGEDEDPVVVSRQAQKPGDPTTPSVNPPAGVKGHITPPQLGHKKIRRDAPATTLDKIKDYFKLEEVLEKEVAKEIVKEFLKRSKK